MIRLHVCAVRRTPPASAAPFTPSSPMALLPVRRTFLAARLSQAPTNSALFRALRRRSTRSGAPQLVEVELREAEAGSGKVEVVGGVDLLEEAIYRAQVMGSAPSWLPFLPGSSYPAPPRSRAMAYRVVEVVGRVARGRRMAPEERLSLLSPRGWPSSKHFLEGLDADSADENSEDNAVKSEDGKDSTTESGDEKV